MEIKQGEINMIEIQKELGEISREQWCLANQMSSAIQCLNSVFCVKSLSELPETETDKDYEKKVATEIARQCSSMQLEDAIQVLKNAYDIKKTQKLEPTVSEKYYELIFWVGKIYPGESRHETALRYIKEAEKMSLESEKQNIEADNETSQIKS